MQKKVLIVTNVDGNGGSEEFTRRVASFLSSQGFTVAIYTLRRTKKTDIFRRVGLRNCNRGHGFFASLSALPRLIREYKPDIVCSFLNKSSHVVRWINCFIPFRHVLFFNSIQITFLDKLFYRFLLPIPKKSIVVADSRITRCFVERILNIAMDLIIPPFYVPQCLYDQDVPARPGPDEVVTFGVISRLSSEKGIWSLLQAIKKLRDDKEVPTFRVRIAGEGKEYTRYMRYIFTHELPVEIIGHIENPYQFLMKVHGYIQPSCYEGFCLTIHEALSVGLFVIASDRAGEITYDPFLPKNNAFFKAQDPCSIAQQLRAFLETPSGEIVARQKKNKAYMLEHYPRARFEKSLSELIALIDS